MEFGLEEIRNVKIVENVDNSVDKIKQLLWGLKKIIKRIGEWINRGI